MDDTALIETPQPSALVLPATDAAAMQQAMRSYTELCDAVLEPSDYQEVKGKRFRKRSAWQKLATAYGVSTEVLRHTVHTNDDGAVTHAEFVVRATAPNGRHEDGYGAASLREKTFTKPDHDIPATAETRARNRACSNLFAFGELTAEELDEPASERSPSGSRFHNSVSDRSSHAGSGGAMTSPAPLTRIRSVPVLRRHQQAQSEVNTSSPPDDSEGSVPADAVSQRLSELRMEAIQRQILLTRALPKYKDLSDSDIWDKAQDLLNASVGMHFSGRTLPYLSESELLRVHKMLDEAIERKLGKE